MLERRAFPGGLAALVSPEMESAGFLVAFTERSGGVSRGVFTSLNLGLGSGDDTEAVVKNRGIVRDALGLQALAFARQVHGSTIAPVGPERVGAGFSDPGNAVPDADGMTTASSGVALAVLTADCVPVALADPEAGRVAVVHAGWRGVAAGVVSAALRRFSHPARLLAAIGPAVGEDHYEVGEDVVAAVSTGTEAAVVARRDGSIHLDLPGTVAAVIRNHGVRRIERAEECTACESERFFSYRRDGRSGRQAVIASRLDRASGWSG
jgi:YfiH family protein